MSIDTTVIEGFTGSVVTPGSDDYDELRVVWNAMHDRRPAVIALCESAADVAAAIRHARAHDLRIAVRGGGHSLPGFSTVDDGLVIDLRRLSAVTVDPVERRVVVQGGALLGDVDRAAQEHGLAVPAGVISHTGAGGLTLGGGVGRLMRRYGLTIDSLLSADLVTADGDVVRASDDANPDLFWALRGGGGNFGVVTSFEFRCHEVSDLMVLATFHRLDEAAAMLRRADETMADPATPDALLWTSFVRKAPPLPWMPEELVGEPGVMSLIEWSGDVGEGAVVLGDLRRELAPTAASLDRVPYLTMQTMGDEVFRHGLHSYIKATFADELTDGLIAALLERAASLGSALAQVEVLSSAVRSLACRSTPRRTCTAAPGGWSTCRRAGSTRPTPSARSPGCEILSRVSPHVAVVPTSTSWRPTRSCGRDGVRRDAGAAAAGQGGSTTRTTSSTSTRTSRRRAS